MAQQYQKLVNKQYNSPIHIYSDRNVKQILERETRVLANGAIGIDFNDPMTNKPANLQNSAVLRMLEEEENRRRSGQPGSLKRVAWPPPNSELEEYIAQEAVQSQGGPLYSSKTAPGLQNNHAPPTQQLPTSPVYNQQKPQSQPKSPTYITNNTFQPIISPSPASSQQSATQSPYQSAPLSPNVSANKSPVSFTSLAKPWSPYGGRSTPQFKPVPAPLTTSEHQSYQSSKQYEYHYQSQDQIRETQTAALPAYQAPYQTSLLQETSFQQYQTPPVVETQHTFEIIKTQEQSGPQSKFSVSKTIEKSPKSPQPFTTSINLQSAQPIQVRKEPPKPESNALYQESPKLILKKPQTPISSEQLVITPIQSQPPPATAQGIAQNQAPPPQRYQVPPKQVEPPPSTITLRPKAPVSQAPPPLVSSQPATATLKGGKNLRGDLKWPPENVRERMAADIQHQIDLSHGPACRPRKQRKDYSSFFAKHALNSTYPGYKIPPGTQFYDHNPVM